MKKINWFNVFFVALIIGSFISVGYFTYTVVYVEGYYHASNNNNIDELKLEMCLDLSKKYYTQNWIDETEKQAFVDASKIYGCDFK